MTDNKSNEKIIVNVEESATEASKTSAGTIARIICLVLALINQGLAIAGKGTIDITDEVIYQFCSYGATIITTLVAAWKNNSVTQAAKKADEVLKQLKSKEAA